MQLNPSQHAVTQSRAARTMVLAGAGTGKTAAAAAWVAELVKEGIRRDQILMLTFTKKAAKEMRDRAEKLLQGTVPADGDALRGAGTYHGIACVLMRRDPVGFGFRNANFSILEESDAKSLWRSVLKSEGVPPRTEGMTPAAMIDLVSKARNRCVDVAEAFQRALSNADAKIAVRAWRGYIEQKESANAVDFDDLLVRWRDRLRADPAYAASLRERWKFVLVDEYQDSNRLQAEIMEALNPEHLLVVGDKLQSIYAFRAASPELTEEFIARNTGCALLKLEDNYRSGVEILDLANQIVGEMDLRLELRSARGTRALVMPLVFGRSGGEAEAVVDWVQQSKHRGTDPTEICVLARSSRAFIGVEGELRRRRIPYRKYGGIALSEMGEVKDFLSFLRILRNPADAIAWVRALVLFPKMGEAGATKFLRHYPNGQIPDGAWPAPARDMGAWLNQMREYDRFGEAAIYLHDRIKPLIRGNYKDDAETRIASLGTLVAYAAEENMSLSDFLDSYSVDRGGDHKHPEDAITLSTIHSAKGLEWERVWLMGVGDQQVPHPRSQSVSELEEEQRLLYVAVTRAKDELRLSFPKQSAPGADYQEASRFLPDELDWAFSY